MSDQPKTDPWKTDMVPAQSYACRVGPSAGATPDQGEIKGVAAVAAGSAWTQSGGVMREADMLEELMQLRLERPGETREAALQWAVDMRRRYTPNDRDVPTSGTNGEK